MTTCETTGRAGVTRRDAIALATGGKMTGRMTYDEACRATFIYTGTAPTDWRAVAIIGTADTVDDKGQPVAMLEFALPAGYQPVATLFEQPAGVGGCCELCGHDIKRAYFIQNDGERLTMTVGSECVTKFGTGKSGDRLAKEARWHANRDLLRQTWAARESLAETFGYRDRITERMMICSASEAAQKIAYLRGCRFSEIGDEERAKANEAWMAWQSFAAILFNSKGAPIAADEMAYATAYWNQRPGYGPGGWRASHSHYHAATDTVISSWVNRNMDCAREAIAKAWQLIKDLCPCT